MSKDIKNKVVVVTGGAIGIGFEIAKKFLEKGAKVAILLDLNEKQGAEAVKAINATFGNNKAVFYRCDVTTDIEKVWKEITDNFKSVDILVNNAGIFNDQNVKKSIDTNVTALIEFSLKFWHYNRTDKSGNGGTIINMASVYGYRIDSHAPVYQASKFAVMGFTKALGHTDNFNRSGVRVLVICPGFTHTALVQDLRTFDESIMKETKEFSKRQLWQNVDAVANATWEVYEIAESGTAWVIEGNKPIEEVTNWSKF